MTRSDQSRLNGAKSRGPNPVGWRITLPDEKRDLEIVGVSATCGTAV